MSYNLTIPDKNVGATLNIICLTSVKDKNIKNFQTVINVL